MSERADLAATISEEEFARLCDFFYRRTGMIFTESKRYYVERRIFERMEATKTATFSQYFARVRMDLDGEVEQIINAFTVNETYFYREEHQLKCLSRDLLAARLGQRETGPLRIWSVPCSTGEEPYSIAMWLLENWPQVDEHDIEILGSDVDTRVLAAAREGYYGARALTRLTRPLIDRYFEQAGEGRWRLAEEMRESVAFSPANLMDSQQTRAHGAFDVIFCRNVLIYFNDESRRIAAENLYECLKPGGFICLGHTESMSRISSLFDVRRFDDAIVYQRPMGAPNG